MHKYSMSTPDLKEAYRLFWMVKGHLNATEETVLGCADGYFKRLWGNHEAVYHEDGFEAAWNEKLSNTNTKNS